ncbi:substrate-binding domain-containing protein [Sphaerisporangium sp. B11E5]|uniref:substrate-binding domain-containing protein n=1 Tax=Sphaerisporangium sp. B11E5 TaxID=3153563 RepID=UPI00325C91BE
MAGRHRNPDPIGHDAPALGAPPPPSRAAVVAAAARRRMIAALAMGAALILVIAAGVYVVVTQNLCTERPRLRVMASPDIGPALERVARWYAAGGGCADVSVRTRQAAEVADELGVHKGLADVWVPDASVWISLARLQGADKILPLQSTSIARSPVIPAVTQKTATRLDGRPSWTLLVPTSASRKKLPKASVTLLAPNRFASGLAAVSSLGTVATTRRELAPIVRGITANLKRSIMTSDGALFSVLEHSPPGSDPVIVASEQAIWSYNALRPDRPAIGLYPGEGAVSLDYPYVPLTADPHVRAAAADFREAVLSATGRTTLQSAGFRTPDAQAGPAMDSRHGLRPAPPADIPGPGPRTLLRTLLTMRLQLADTRTLLLLDVSASMDTPVPGLGKTRMEATADLAARGIETLPDGSDVGLWIFSTGLAGAKDHQELVPLGPVLQNTTPVIEALRELPARTRGGTGLYDSVLAAFRAASAQQVDGMLTSVIVFTDGHDDDKAGISRNALLSALQEEFDSLHPVTVTLIGHGPAADPEELRAIAEVTNGAAMTPATFEQAAQVFLQALSGKVCVGQEQCPADPS